VSDLDPRDQELVGAIAREVAALLRQREQLELLDARQVAMVLGVTPEWVYAHADELGAIRLGDGGRPRLRFDLAVLRERLAPALPPPRQQPRGHVNGHSHLLPIKPRDNHREE